MSWREYSKELNAARGVFRNTPAVGRIGGRLSWGIEELSQHNLKKRSSSSSIRDSNLFTSTRDSGEESSTDHSAEFNETFLERMRRMYPTRSKENNQVEDLSSISTSIYKFTSETDPSSKSSWSYDHSEVSKFMNENQVFSKPFLQSQSPKSFDTTREDSIFQSDSDLSVEVTSEPPKTQSKEKETREEDKRNSFGTNVFKDGFGKKIASWNPRNW